MVGVEGIVLLKVRNRMQSVILWDGEGEINFGVLAQLASSYDAF